jgi:formamidopyrimidine-DNA glycosylase
MVVKNVTRGFTIKTRFEVVIPEFAECAIFAKDLTDYIGGARVERVETPVVGYAEKWCVIKEIPEPGYWDFSSCGKLIVLGVSNEPRDWARIACPHVYYGIRLGMTGRFSIDCPPEHEPHCFLKVHLDNGKCFHYIDFRRFSKWETFGKFYAFPAMSLGGYRNPESVSGRLRFSSGNIWTNDLFGNQSYTGLTTWEQKFPTSDRITYLLKTGSLTGVGNYMANEALGRMNLNPFEQFDSHEEIHKVFLMCLHIGLESYEAGGNSFAGGYYRLDGSLGKYAEKCQFYQNPTVIRTVHRGRPVYSNFTL